MLGTDLTLAGLASRPRRAVSPPGNAPGAIADLTATVQSDTEVLLEWTPAEDAIGHRYRIGAGPWLDCDDNSGAQLVEGLSASTEYSFRVRGVNADGFGPSSNLASATTEEGEEPEPPDIVAPVLTSPEAAATSSATADLSVSTDTGEGTLYLYISESVTPPSASDLKAGTGAVWPDSQAVSGTGEQTAEAAGLTAETTYYAHFLHRDAAGNDSEIATSDSFETEATPEAQRLLIAILAGQSNAQGRAMRDEGDTDVEGAWQFVTWFEDADYQTIVSDITPMRGPDDEIDENPDTLTMGEYLMRQVLEDGHYDDVLAVPCAVGGTAMVDSGSPWHPGNPGGSLFEGMIAEANAAISAAGIEFPGHTIEVALFWVQGEGDALGDVPQADYETAFADVVSYARSRITGATAMPVVIGSMVPDLWAGSASSDAGYEAINRAHVAASLDIAGVYYSRGADDQDISGNDNLHYLPAAVQRVQSRRLGAVLEAVRAGGSGPAMTSGGTLEVETDTPFFLNLTAEGSHKTFHIVGGVDAELFEISDPYTAPKLRGAGDAGLEEGEYEVEVAARDGNGRFGAAQAITVTASVPEAASEVTFVPNLSPPAGVNTGEPHHTFEDVAFPALGRQLVAIATSNRAGGPEAVTIGGVTATKVATSSESDNFAASIWVSDAALAPGDHDVAITGTLWGKAGIANGTLTGADPTPTDMAAGNFTFTSPYTTSESVMVDEGGLALVALAHDGSTTVNWSDATEVIDNGGGDVTISLAVMDASGTPSAMLASGSGGCMVAAAFGLEEE